MKTFWTTLAVYCIGIHLFGVRTDAKRVSGSVRNDGLFVFLTDFCFAKSTSENTVAGTLSATITTNQEDLYLYLYDDQPDSWPVAEELSCQEATRSSDPYYRGEINIQPTYEGFYINHGFIEYSRPRYWYFVTAGGDCQNDPQISQYEMHLLNGDSELSYDEFGIPETMIFFFCMWLILAGVSVVALFYYKRMFDFVSVVTVSAICLRAFGLLFLVLHWSVYENNGYGLVVAEGLGRVLYIIANLSMLNVAAICATGYVPSSIEHLWKSITSSIIMFVLLLIAELLYCALAIWWEFKHDSSSTRYVYDTGIGVAIAITIFLMGCVVIWRLVTRRSRTSSTEVRRNVNYGLCCLLPIFSVWILEAIIAASVIDYKRKNTVVIFDLVAITLTNMLIAYYVWKTVFKHAIGSLYSDLDASTTTAEQGQEVWVSGNDRRQRLLSDSDSINHNLEDGNMNDAIGDDAL